MILLLDVGNSFLKWAWLESAWMKHRQDGLPVLSDADECLHAGEAIYAVLDEVWADFPVPEQVWLSNVAGDVLEEALLKWITQHWHCSVSVAVTASRSDQLINAYTVPSQLGVDRWLGLLAANRYGKSAHAVFDCGTAITLDALDARGKHLGGLILPGIKMMHDALFKDAEGVTETAPGEPVAGMLFANDTKTAVDVGCQYSVIAFIERVIGDMQKEIGKDLHCIITGGDAEELLPLLRVNVDYQPLLVLQGLAIHANRNKE